MKLSSFPYLVQKEVLDHLSINHLFSLSLCSKNTNSIIKEIQKDQLKKVERVSYCIHAAHPRIDLKIANEEHDLELMYFYKNTRVQKYKSEKKDAWTAQINFRGCLNRDSILHVTYCPAILESIIESIHNQLYDLLGDHSKFWLDNKHYDVGEATCIVPLLQNIQKIDFFGDAFESTKIDKFLDGSTCLEYFLWDTSSERPIQLRENSKLFDLDTVYVSSAEFHACPMANDVMKRFNGRHAFLGADDITTPDVIQFLNEWKSGEKFKNLELICLDGFFNVQEIRNSVQIKEVDREMKYSFIRKFEDENNSFRHLESGEFKSHYYMVRESDGRVASVLLTEELIFLGVWNMTKKDFLMAYSERQKKMKKFKNKKCSKKNSKIVETP